MKKVSRIFLKIGEIIIRLVYFGIGLGVIGVVGYFFANFYLKGIHGTDTTHALSLVDWVGRYWPKLPFWHHLQGAGVSLRWNYPFLASILVVLINKLTGLGILGSFQILGFTSFLLTALGMYLFVSWRLKNQTAGLMAAVFYFITPLSYAYFVDWGFYAELVACMFFFPPLIFYDLFLEGFLSGKMKSAHRLGLLLAAVFTALLFNVHPNTFFALLGVIGFQTIIRAAFSLKKEKGKKLGRFLSRAFAPSFLVFLLAVFLTAFIVFNFTYYERAKKDFASPSEIIAGIQRGDFEHFKLHQSFPRESFLGLGTLSPEHYLFPLRNITISPLVWGLALAGLVLTLIFDRKVFASCLPAFLAFGVIVYPNVFFGPIRFLVKMRLPGIGYLLKQRVYLTLIRSLFPIAAAFGLVGGGKLLFEILVFWRRWLKNKLLLSGLNLAGQLFVSFFALLAFGYLLYYAADKPRGRLPWYQANYGYPSVDIRDPFGRVPLPELGSDVPLDLHNLRFACGILDEGLLGTEVCARLNWDKDFSQDMAVLAEFREKCRLPALGSLETEICPFVMTNKKDLYQAAFRALKNQSYWPRPELFKPEDFPGEVFPYPGFRDFFDLKAGEKNVRVDVSPTAGGMVMGFNIVTDMSMVSLYTHTASLLGPYWGHAQQVLFQENDGREETATEIAKWLGTKYLLVNASIDSTAKYFQKGGWEAELRDEDGRPKILRLKDAPKMATWTKAKPTILVIGNKERRVFEPVFRASNKGALPYDDFWLVEGQERIDDYSLEELQKFEILYLFGYSYKNRGQAWGLIDAYLKNGGGVFLSTGWQYVDQDWQVQGPPAWFPVTGLSWSQGFEQSLSYDIDLGEIGGGWSADGFGPLNQGGVSYGVSLPAGLREWARPVLTVDQKPLVAVGKYGQGRIVWSGLNLVGHMHSFDYPQAEILFHQALFNWLGGEVRGTDLSDEVEIIRDYPDRVEFNFGQGVEGLTTLYWREAAFPSWKAKIGKKDLRIYYGGPRLMLMRLEDVRAGDRLVLEFKPGLRHLFLKLISVMTFLSLIVYLVFGKKIYRPFSILLNDRFKKAKTRAKKNWDKGEEEEY
ncbi:MAG: hypothetical protein JW991_05565 [Candidatus Pacebacteria bacterium]|nr:hypothetical protein [Candidatus Paceibacterota bacterium]